MDAHAIKKGDIFQIVRYKKSTINYVFCKIVTSSCIVVIQDRGINKWGSGGGHAPPDFVKIEGAAGQRGASAPYYY